MQPAVNRNVVSMSPADKVAEALRRSLPYLPAEARQQVLALISPETIIIILGTLTIWAGSHFFGVGELVDIVLLLVGGAMIGGGVFQFAEELYKFATIALQARSEADLTAAGQHFARAVAIGGMTAVTAVLLHRSASDVIARGRPTIRPGLVNAGAPPTTPDLFFKPTISRPVNLPSGALGQTDWYGNISVTRSQTIEEQRLTLYHEWVHSVLSPKLRYAQQFRAALRASAYWRSALIRWLEEALAESYGQLRVRGLGAAWQGLSFPVGPPGQAYVTLSELASEGRAIGNIVLGGRYFYVYLRSGQPPRP